MVFVRPHRVRELMVSAGQQTNKLLIHQSEREGACCLARNGSELVFRGEEADTTYHVG